MEERLGENIRKRREELDMPQSVLARKVHVNPSLICRIEKNAKTPSLPLLKEIADALECSVGSILS